MSIVPSALGWFKGLCERLGFTPGQALAVVLCAGYLLSMGMSLNGKIDALGRDLADYRAESRAEIMKLEHKIELAVRDINHRMELMEAKFEKKLADMEARLNAKIADMEKRIAELKMNDIAHVARGISEIAFLLVQRGVLSQDEAEHVRDVVEGR
ncbi:MAG: hypothetical protein LBR38_00205 [Synergistaceae bacterium]|jgi:polyhydroxyalkanoate synthesis regulator phasin|nr:hypothetical protein [Synergistaceae bacterium]